MGAESMNGQQVHQPVVDGADPRVEHEQPAQGAEGAGDDRARGHHREDQASPRQIGALGKPCDGHGKEQRDENGNGGEDGGVVQGAVDEGVQVEIAEVLQGIDGGIQRILKGDVQDHRQKHQDHREHDCRERDERGARAHQTAHAHSRKRGSVGCYGVFHNAGLKRPPGDFAMLGLRRFCRTLP